MKYTGWILAILFLAAAIAMYRIKYLPLQKSVTKLEQEIAMWEEVVKGQKGISGDRYRFPAERFFEGDKLTPYAEVDIIRNFDPHYQGLELYITAPKALDRASDVLRFLLEQRLDYRSVFLTTVLDSLERFEYKFNK
jgi:hypothetical protein